MGNGKRRDPNDNLYDVIVVGAGPAGLSVASVMSEHLEVLVLDRKATASHTTKSWFVPSFVKPHVPKKTWPWLRPGVQRFVVRMGTSKVPLDTEWDARVENGYLFIDEHGILQHWADTVQANGSRVLLGCEYRRHEVEADGVIVETSKGNFRARLLIDASGHDSPIRAQYGEDPDLYWWSVCGGIYRHRQGLDPNLKVGDYLLWATFKDLVADPNQSLANGMPVMEYEILGRETSFPMVLYLRKQKVPVDEMRRVFDHMMTRESLNFGGRPVPMTELFAGTEKVEEKFGWYPSGGLSQRFAADRVAFVGDAGCWSTACGWGMCFILENFASYARHLTTRVNRDIAGEWGALSAAGLRSEIKVDAHEMHAMSLNRLAARFLSHGSADQLTKFAGGFLDLEARGRDGWILCEKVFTLSPSLRDLRILARAMLPKFTIPELLTIFPPEELPTLLAEAGLLGWQVLLDLESRLDDRLNDRPHRTPPVWGRGFEIAR